MVVTPVAFKLVGTEGRVAQTGAADEDDLIDEADVVATDDKDDLIDEVDVVATDEEELDVATDDDVLPL